jgi:hypothetical protein
MLHFAKLVHPPAQGGWRAWEGQRGDGGAGGHTPHFITYKHTQNKGLKKGQVHATKNKAGTCVPARSGGHGQGNGTTNRGGCTIDTRPRLGSCVGAGVVGRVPVHH